MPQTKSTPKPLKPVVNQKPSSSTPSTHHRVRTVFASLLGIFAVSLILASLVLVWLNRTLSDTSTYVKTVAPLATRPEIQLFVATKTSEAIVKNASTQDLAAALLPPGMVTDKNVDQLKTAVQPVIFDNILKVVKSNNFANLWESSNQTAHAALIKQLNNNSDTITLDLNPVVTGVIAQLSATTLGTFSEKIDIKPENAKLSLKGSGIQNAQRYYQDFQRSVWVVVALAVASLAGAIALSVHHLKTARRILFGTGVLSLLFGFAVWASAYINVGNDADQTTKKALVAVVQTLFHNLFLASLILGVICIGAAIGTKAYSHLRK